MAEPLTTLELVMVNLAEQSKLQFNMVCLADDDICKSHNVSSVTLTLVDLEEKCDCSRKRGPRQKLNPANGL